MTYTSPITSNGCLANQSKKGSTYGKQEKCWSSVNSFQEHQRDGGLNNTDGTQVLYRQITLFPLRTGSIILASEPARDTTLTRDS
jgi:hypothetical protein